MSLTITQDGPDIRIEMSETLTIFEAVAIKEEMMNCLDGAESIELDLSQTVECDCAGLQLLCAASKSAEKKKIAFRISGVPEAVKSAFASAGVDLSILIETERESTLHNREK